MLRWVLIIAFIILFSLFAGFVTTLVFGSKEGWYSGGSEYDRKENKKMILLVAFTATLAGIFWTPFLLKSSHWILIGLCFGMTTTMITPLLIYLYDTWQDLILRTKPGINVDTHRAVLSELYKSVSLVGAFFMSLMALLYGMILLITPLLGLLWGYLMHHFILRIK